MQYIKGLSQYESDRESAVTFGKFDGLHKGHQKLVSKVRELSKENNVNSIVCAFDMHPLWERISAVPQIIMDKRERELHLAGQVDFLVDCPFTTKFSQMSAEAFIEEIICGLFHARFVVVGTDFRFGYEKRGEKRYFYFHSAAEGRKIDLIKTGLPVGFEMDTSYQLTEAETACGFSAKFQSIIGTGNISLIETAEEKIHALEQIMFHNTGNGNWKFSEKLLSRMSVFMLEVVEISCKQHQ